MFELAKELRNAGFPNIRDVQLRQGRQFLASDGRVSFCSLGELALRKPEFAFGSDPFMFFGHTLDAVARVTGVSLRGGNEMTNLIGTGSTRSKKSRFELDDLADIEFMSH